MNWKEPIDGGQIATYKCSAASPDASGSSGRTSRCIWTAMESEITLNGQTTRSKEFKYRLPLADCQYESLPVFGWPPRVARCLKVVGGCLTVAGDCLTVESRCLKVAGGCLTVENRCRAAEPLFRTGEKIILAAEPRNCMLISQL